MQDVDKITDTNLLIENTYRLVSNVTELHETHLALVQGKGMLVAQVIKMFQNYI